ncbi:hypothetical protein [uncultured Rhodoblastus sp.]|uniref:hypothetical protein n=1 Tax=uncultured Rhodoblastus sp. TaxID=543037 RepID=UPI0025E80F36|nr:hypothetical protein [uncultured Rhodoblastus sp.]
MTALPDKTEIDKQTRAAAAEEFALCAAYCDLIIGHLQVGDDAGVVWSMELFRGAGRRAFAAFAPIRDAMRARARPEISEAAE